MFVNLTCESVPPPHQPSLHVTDQYCTLLHIVHTGSSIPDLYRMLFFVRILIPLSHSLTLSIYLFSLQLSISLSLNKYKKMSKCWLLLSRASKCTTLYTFCNSKKFKSCTQNFNNKDRYNLFLIQLHHSQIKEKCKSSYKMARHGQSSDKKCEGGVGSEDQARPRMAPLSYPHNMG